MVSIPTAEVYVSDAPVGALIQYSMDTPNGPHLVIGEVSASTTGMMRLGNVGVIIKSCMCGNDHNISRYAVVTIID